MKMRNGIQGQSSLIMVFYVVYNHLYKPNALSSAFHNAPQTVNSQLPLMNLWFFVHLF